MAPISKDRSGSVWVDGTTKDVSGSALFDMEILNRPRGFGWHSVLVGASASTINCPDQPLVIGLAFQVSGCRRLRPADTVSDRQPDEDKAIADAIESSPPEAPHYFERRVRDLSYDFWFSEAFSRAFSALAENAFYSEPIVPIGFHRGADSDLKSATSGLWHQFSRWV
jgi:hypothetical protein